MKTECSATTKDGKCKNTAEFIVERNDLSHRKVPYCKYHADPYRSHPADFSVTETK